jgi:hypothetical protein
MKCKVGSMKEYLIPLKPVFQVYGPPAFLSRHQFLMIGGGM